MLGDLLVSAQQAAHKWLREMILSGELPAGQALRQEEIARRLGISRLPIREALNRLATEGLVELKPRRGFYVASLNIDEIEDIFEMRSMPTPWIDALQSSMPSSRPAPTSTTTRNSTSGFTNACLKAAHASICVVR